MKAPNFDIAEAHRYFAADCFNRVWELLDNPGRGEDDHVRMVALAHASLWHWTARSDCTSQNLSIAYWLLSRVYATVGNAAEARRHGLLCLRHSGEESPFYLAYAHEALARAELLAGDDAVAQHHLQTARDLAELVTDAGDRAALEKDLATIR